MAFGEQNEVQKLPKDFNLGVIEGAANQRDSKNNPLNQVVDITIRPVMAARKRDGGEKFYLTIRDAWFSGNHTPKDLEDYTEKFLYNKFFGRKGSKEKGFLQQVFKEEQRAELRSLVETQGISSVAEFVSFLNEYLRGKIIGYVTEQQYEREKVTNPETGEEKTEKYPTEFKGVTGFFGPDEIEGLEKAAARAIDRAQEEYKKTGEKTFPTMRIFWEAGVNPFEAAMESLTA